jgi:SsrA-binding protein
MARQQSHQIKPEKPRNVKRDPIASGERDASVNRQASHTYFLSDKLETGIMLRGTEVKSVRSGQANLKDAFAQVKDNELWLLNAHIGPYEHGNVFNHEPTRTRKLLANRDQIRKLWAKSQQKGFTLVPTRMYFKNGRAKVEIALAKGKQTWDKRETERKRTAENEAKAAMNRAKKNRL